MYIHGLLFVGSGENQHCIYNTFRSGICISVALSFSERWQVIGFHLPLCKPPEVSQAPGVPSTGLPLF